MPRQRPERAAPRAGIVDDIKSSEILGLPFRNEVASGLEERREVRRRLKKRWRSLWKRRMLAKLNASLAFPNLAPLAWDLVASEEEVCGIRFSNIAIRLHSAPTAQHARCYI